MRISSYIVIKRDIDFDGKTIHRAYWRGTNNRVKYLSGLMVAGYTHKKDLLFDLRNNPMERGVIVE